MNSRVFKCYLDKHDIKYFYFPDSNGFDNYYITCDLGKPNLREINITFVLDRNSDEYGPIMIGFNFFKSGTREMNMFVNSANKFISEEYGKDFIFYIQDTGGGNEVIIEYGTRTETIITVDGRTVYDHYVGAIGDMVNCISNLVG